MKTILIIFILLICCNLYCQNKKDIIKGNVNDVYGESLIGVNVVIVHNDKYIGGTISDKNGYYEISIPDSLVEFKLEFSLIGLKKKEIFITRENKKNEKTKKH